MIRSNEVAIVDAIKSVYVKLGQPAFMYSRVILSVIQFVIYADRVLPIAGPTVESYFIFDYSGYR